MKRVCVAAAAVLGLLIATPAAGAAPVAPTPTDAGRSPAAPDPHPPLAGRAPNGAVAGGDALLSRGVIKPAHTPKIPADVGAQAWVLADLDSGDILAARDPHGRYQPASILKMLTALTVLPNLPGDRQVTVSRTAAHAEGSSVGLLDGATYSVDELFSALMLVSGNDAATALAEANGGISTTVAQMNQKAEQLGMYDTFVETPSGLDGWNQLTSAYDMAEVLQQAVHNDRLKAYDRQLDRQFPLKKNGHGGVIPAFTFSNQSQEFLTTVPGALLSKTGYTDAAQHTYLAAVHDHGRNLGVVFLRNQRWPLDQWQQAVKLFAWADSLKPGTPPVGHLDGPISAEAPVAGRSLPAQPQQVVPTPSGVAAPLLSLAPDGTPKLAASAASTPHHGSAPTWLIGLVALLGAGAVMLARWRRPLPPRDLPQDLPQDLPHGQRQGLPPVPPLQPTQRSTTGTGPAGT